MYLSFYIEVLLFVDSPLYSIEHTTSPNTYSLPTTHAPRYSHEFERFLFAAPVGPPRCRVCLRTVRVSRSRGQRPFSFTAAVTQVIRAYRAVPCGLPVNYLHPPMRYRANNRSRQNKLKLDRDQDSALKIKPPKPRPPKHYFIEPLSALEKLVQTRVYCVCETSLYLAIFFLERNATVIKVSHVVRSCFF